MEISFNSRSFKTLLVAQFLFMAGYISLKYILTLYLMQGGFGITQAYSLSMGASALFAISALTWGTLLKHFSSHHNLIISGAFILLVSFFFILCESHFFKLIGISLYAIGGSLYFININLLINKHFQQQELRQQGNHIYQIIFNVGALVGLIMMSIVPINNHSHMLIYLSACMVCGSLIILVSQRKFILSHKISDTKISNSRLKFIITLSVLLFMSYLLLDHTEIEQGLVITAFTLSCLYILSLAIKEKTRIILHL